MATRRVCRTRSNGNGGRRLRPSRRRERFFHWQLEFPEVFFDAGGQPLERPGFDAVIGNPPWADARALVGVQPRVGLLRIQGGGHANLYQLFAERMLQLTARGGRAGMLMPSGLLADHGCAALRRYLFERCEVDAVLGFDNREGLFPIHRGLRFSLITASAGGSTAELRIRCGIRSAAPLEDVPDSGPVPGAVSVPLALVRRFSGEGMAVPELEHERDRVDSRAHARRGPAARQRRGLGRPLRARAQRD